MDKELISMRKILKLLADLPPDARARVIRWAADKATSSPVSSTKAPEIENDSDF